MSSEEERDVESSFAENVRLGYMEVVGVSADGEVTYALTDAGRKHVEDMFGGREGALEATKAMFGDPKEHELLERVAQAIRDANGSSEAQKWWSEHPMVIPAHLYAEAAIDEYRKTI